MMSEDTTLPGIERTELTDITDVTDATDTSLITEITQAVSSVVGKRRAERRSQKIRNEIVRERFETEPGDPPPSKFSIKKLFRLE